MCRQGLKRILRRLIISRVVGLLLLRPRCFCRLSKGPIFSSADILAVFHLVQIEQFFYVAVCFESHIRLFGGNRFHLLLMPLVFSETLTKLHVRVLHQWLRIKHLPMRGYRSRQFLSACISISEASKIYLIHFWVKVLRVSEAH